MKMLKEILFGLSLASFSPLQGLADQEFPKTMVKVVEDQTFNVVITKDNHASVINRKRLLKSLVPTHVMRMSADVSSEKVSCDEVSSLIDKEFTRPIVENDFFYMIFLGCGYDIETELATNFRFSMVFDPMSSEAVEKLQDFVTQNQNKKLLGQIFNVEQAKRAIVMLTVQAGLKKDPYAKEFVMYQQDKSYKIFPTYLDSLNFNADARQRFYSQKPDQVLAFLSEWFGSYMWGMYNRVLRQSTLAELHPDKVLLMENGEELHAPLQVYFAHWCSKYPNGFCM